MTNTYTGCYNLSLIYAIRIVVFNNSTLCFHLLRVATIISANFFSSFVGATAIIGGLYVVLWGKTEDLKGMEGQRHVDFKKSTISIDTESHNWETDIQQPLLTNKSGLE